MSAGLPSLRIAQGWRFQLFSGEVRTRRPLSRPADASFNQSGVADGMKRDRPRTLHRIGRGARVEGTVRFSGRLEVEGRVQGTILAEDVRSSAVRVSASGQVDGAIEAAVVHVAGTVNGPIRASKRLVVQSGARLNGDLLYRDLQLEYGALVTGSLKSLDSDDVGLKLVAVGRK